jgi:RNA polymerase sigma factor (sigma-70 family)
MSMSESSTGRSVEKIKQPEDQLLSPLPLQHLTDEERREQFAEYYRADFPRLVAFLMWLGATFSDAAEVAQDTMAEAFKGWSSIQKPKAWTRTVASRIFLRKISSVEAEILTESLPEPPMLVRDDPGELYWEQEHQIYAVLKGLPPRQRQVFAWSLEGFSPKEIADILSIDPAAARQSLKKARRAVAAIMVQHHGSESPDNG